MRLIALTCSNTEIVCALGCGDQLVAVDDHSDYPEETVERLPRVGPDLGIDVRRVAELRPDLVLASLTVPGHEKVVQSLVDAGLPYVATEPTRLEHVYDDIRTLGAHLGVAERARKLEAEMRAAIQPMMPRERPARVLVEWWPKPVIVPGTESWVTDLIDAAGGCNPLERAVKSTPITDDDARELEPDAVVISWCGVKPTKYRPEIVYRRERWHELPALAQRRVYCVPEAFLGRPGPRLVEGYRALVNVVQACGSERPLDPCPLSSNRSSCPRSVPGK